VVEIHAKSYPPSCGGRQSYWDLGGGAEGYDANKGTGIRTLGKRSNMYGVGLLNAYSVRQVYFGFKRSHQTMWLERVSVELDQFSMFSIFFLNLFKCPTMSACLGVNR